MIEEITTGRMSDTAENDLMKEPSPGTLLSSSDNTRNINTGDSSAGDRRPDATSRSSGSRVQTPDKPTNKEHPSSVISPSRPQSARRSSRTSESDEDQKTTAKSKEDGTKRLKQQRNLVGSEGSSPGLRPRSLRHTLPLGISLLKVTKDEVVGVLPKGGAPSQGAVKQKKSGRLWSSLKMKSTLIMSSRLTEAGPLLQEPTHPSSSSSRRPFAPCSQ